MIQEQLDMNEGVARACPTAAQTELFAHSNKNTQYTKAVHRHRPGDLLHTHAHHQNKELSRYLEETKVGSGSDSQAWTIGSNTF